MHRRRFSTRLSHAFLTLLVALSIGCEFNRMSQYEKRKHDITNGKELLEKAGGKATEARHPLAAKAYAVDLTGAKLSDDAFAAIRKLKYITELNVSKSDITDAQLKEFGDPKGIGALLGVVNVSDTAITNEGVVELANLGFLRSIEAKGSKVTSAALDRINEIRQSSPNIVFKEFRKIQMKL